MSETALKRNIKIYPFYRAFSYDFLFFWTISILFLTEVKGLSYSQVILLDSLFMLSAFCLQVPISKMIRKIGRVSSARLGAIAYLGFAFLNIFGTSFLWFLIANVLYGIGAAIKNVADTEILSISLQKLNRKNDFSKIDGKAMFWYYLFEGLTSVVAGYLFEFVNPYAPIIATTILSMACLIFAFIIKDPASDEESTQEVKHSEAQNEPSYRALLKRPFVIWMAIFCFSFFGVSSVYQTMSKVYLQNINVPAYLFGYIFCCYRIIAAISSKFQFKYELKRGVKILLVSSFMMVSAYIVSAIIYTIAADAVISIIIVLLIFASQHISRSLYRITVKNYINQCVTKRALTRTLTIYSMAEFLGYSLTTLFVSLVMEISGNSYLITNFSLVGVFIIPLTLSVIFFMRALIKSYMSRCTIVRKDLE